LLHANASRAEKACAAPRFNPDDGSAFQPYQAPIDQGKETQGLLWSELREGDERLLVAYSVEKLATRRLDENSTAQNDPGSTIVIQVMVERPRKTPLDLPVRSFSTQ
jgi:hypothetical protein